MVGRGPLREDMIPLASVNADTPYGAFVNKFMRDHTGDAPMTGTGGSLSQREALQLKKDFYKLYAHCVDQIDIRFPTENMECFQLMQVLDPNVVHGPLRRNKIGSDDLPVAVDKLVKMFEVPLHASGCVSPAAVSNAFILFRASDVYSDVWKEFQAAKVFDHSDIYAYYRKILQSIPDIRPWAMFALFVLVFPTGNAISERGFSAMGRAKSKQRSELGNDQVFAHLIIGFNGPSVIDFSTQINTESRQPNWPLYIHPNNYNM
jgi:hypothetical protein